MSYKAGIVEAITELKDRNGSSMIAIKKYMQAKLPKDKKWQNATFLQALKSGVAAGDFVQHKQSYKLSAEFKKKAKKSSKAPTKKAKAAPKKVSQSAQSRISLSSLGRCRISLNHSSMNDAEESSRRKEEEHDKGKEISSKEEEGKYDPVSLALFKQYNIISATLSSRCEDCGG